ncbi:MAG: hypothetical protein ACE5OP_02155 [Candidatus Glassbacteria bacterium]
MAFEDDNGQFIIVNQYLSGPGEAMEMILLSMAFPSREIIFFSFLQEHQFTTSWI